MRLSLMFIFSLSAFGGTCLGQEAYDRAHQYRDRDSIYGRAASANGGVTGIYHDAGQETPLPHYQGLTSAPAGRQVY